MKKIFAALLAVVLMLTIFTCTAMATDNGEDDRIEAIDAAIASEAPADGAVVSTTYYNVPAVAAPKITINVTQVVIAVMAVLFNLLLAWILTSVIPPVKKWLDEHTTSEQQNRVWTITKWLVEAAEQTITGYSKGRERLQWVLDQLCERGIMVDMDLIEAAVKEMKDKAAIEIHEAVIDKPPEDLPSSMRDDLK